MNDPGQIPPAPARPARARSPARVRKALPYGAAEPLRFLLAECFF